MEAEIFIESEQLRLDFRGLDTNLERHGLVKWRDSGSIGQRMSSMPIISMELPGSRERGRPHCHVI